MATSSNRDAAKSYVEVEYPEHLDVLLQEANLEKLADVIAKDQTDLNAIQAAAKEILAAAGVTGMDETAAFADGAEKTTGRRTRKNTGRTNKVVVDAARQLINTNYGVCAQVVSSLGGVVAYLTPTPEHFDISKSSKTLEDKSLVTDFAVKMVGPGPVRGYAVAVPANAIEEVRKYLHTENADPDICNVERANAKDQPFVLELFTPDVFTESFLNSEAAGSIAEADALFAPCTIRRYMNATKSYKVDSYNTLADVAAVKPNALIVAGPNAIAFQMSYKKINNVQTPIARAKHTLRPRFQAPGNYIPARIYETIPMKEQYAADEAKELNKVYFGRFSTAKYKGEPLLSTIDAKNTSVHVNIDTDSNVKYIQSTGFFATNASETALKTPINHWYNRGADGLPMQITPVGQGLIKRVSEPTKAGGTKVKICYKEIQAEQNAMGDAYVPDFSGDFKKIGDACAAYGVKLEVPALIKFFKDANVIRDKSDAGRNKGRKTAPKPMGLAAFGFSITAKSTELQEALKYIGE